jgi:hypothetical protein
VVVPLVYGQLCIKIVSSKILTYFELALLHISVTACCIKHMLYTLETASNQYSVGNMSGE